MFSHWKIIYFYKKKIPITSSFSFLFLIKIKILKYSSHTNNNDGKFDTYQI